MINYYLANHEIVQLKLINRRLFKKLQDEIFLK